MKLLLFSDLHGDVTAARRLVALAAQVDLLVGAGDFGNLRRHVQRTIDVLAAVEKPACLVPGNNESLAELRDACAGWPTAEVLHGSGCELLDMPFFGLGGAVPVTPFGDWSFDLTEAEAAERLAACPAAAVLVSHSPPHGVLDRSSRGKQLGSVAVRETVLQKRPRLVVCGHIHASSGAAERLEGIPVVNAGPAGMLWDLARDAAASPPR